MSSSVQFLGDSDGVKVPLKNAAEEKQSMVRRVLAFCFDVFVFAFVVAFTVFVCCVAGMYLWIFF